MEPTGSEEVKIPKLAPNGQNWKIYHAKVIEAAATDITDPLGVLAGWQPDDGSYNWECLDAILKWTFYTTVPITILHPIRKLDTVHEIFKYLVRCFCDPNPIVDPHATSANEAKRGTDENSHAEWRESPTSENAAIERHADTNRDEEDLPNTQDLPNRGTESVDGQNIGQEDLHTSIKVLVTGKSAECADGTLILSKGVLHETQNSLQNSLQTTPRLPIEGELSECEQEAVESVVTAGRMNGMVGTAEPPEVADTDVDRMALLGREPARSASRVDEGDGTEHEGKSRLQETRFYCKASCQHSGNAQKDVPEAHRVPLEGEWAIGVSGSTKDSRAHANASNALGMRTDGLCRQQEPVDTSMEPRSCKSGTSVRTCIDEADGDPGQGVEPTGIPNESDTLVIVSMELESPNSGGILCMYLGSTSWRADDTNGPGSRTDMSSGQMDRLHGQADTSRGQTDAPSVSNGAETVEMSHNDTAGTYLGTGGAKRGVMEMNGVETHTDTLSGQTELPNVQMNANKPSEEPENVSIPPEKAKPPDLPVKTVKRTPDEPNGLGNQTDGSSMCTDVHSIGNERETAANETVNVSTHRINSETQNSPYTNEIATFKRASRWKRVSADGTDVYLPCNAPVEALG